MDNTIYPLTVKDHYEGPRTIHLDLTRLIAISEPEFEDAMGFGGYFANVVLHYQLRDNPVVVKVQLPSALRPTPEDPETQAAFNEFKEAVGGLLTAWKTYLKEKQK